MCYISMNREDGLAAAEVVHETIPGDLPVQAPPKCSRCNELDLQLDAQKDYELVDDSEDDCSFSETISY